MREDKLIIEEREGQGQENCRTSTHNMVISMADGKPETTAEKCYGILLPGQDRNGKPATRCSGCDLGK